jgi:hypothetical protein
VAKLTPRFAKSFFLCHGALIFSLKIFERSIGRVQGLARLLAIEKLATPESRNLYQQRRGVLRGRPTQNSGFIAYSRRVRRYNGDLKANAVLSGLESSEYDIVNLHIPYGSGWDAKRIEKLVYKTVRLYQCP